MNLRTDTKEAVPERSGPTSGAAAEALNRLVLVAATSLDVALGGISVVENGREVVVACSSGRVYEAGLEASMARRVVESGTRWAVEDVHQDERFATHPLVAGDAGIRLWAGVPVAHPTQGCIGVLWAASPEPRRLDEREWSVLEQLAELAAERMAPQELAPDGAPLREAADDARRTDVDLQLRMLDAVGQAVIATDPVGTIIYWNEAAEELYGWEADDVIGRAVTDVTPTDATAEQAREIMVALQQGEAWHGEFNVRHRDGSEFPVYVTDTPVFDRHGELAAVIGVSMDLREHNRMARELRRSERRFVKLFHGSPVAACILTLPDLRFVDANESYAALVGHARSTLVGRTTAEVGLRVEPSMRARAVARLKREGRISNVRYPLPTASGATRTVLISAELMELDGQTCAVAQLTDITGLEQAREQLARSEARWQRLIDRHPEPIIVSQGSEIVYSNPATARVLGADSHADLEGTSFYDFIPASHHDVLRERLQVEQTGRYAAMQEYPLHTLDRDIRHVEAIGVAIQLDGVDALLTVARDITGRKKMEHALRDSQRFLGATLDALPAHIAVLDERGAIIDTNAAWRRFAEANGGASGATGIGANYLAVCESAAGPCSDEAPDVAAAIRDLLAGRRAAFTLEYPCHSADEKRWFVIRMTRFAIDGDTRVVVAHENVTERKLAEREVARRERMQRALVEALPDAVLRVRTSGRIVDARVPAGTPLLDVDDVRPDQFLQELLQEAHSTIMLDYIDDAHASREIRTWKCLIDEDDTVTAFEMRFVPNDRDEVLIVIRDVSHERQLEAKILEISGREQRRIGRDIHDGLGQTLTGLSYMSRSLARKLHDDTREHDIAERLHTEIEEAIREAHALSHGLNPVELVDDDLATALAEMARRVEEVHGITCRFRRDGEPTVSDPVATYHLHRIAQEAVTNAIKHAASSSIVLDLTCTEGQLVLEIRDAGRGLASNVEPYRGMGLQTMRYRANLIGASLRIDSTPGAGTTVTCVLPVRGIRASNLH